MTEIDEKKVAANRRTLLLILFVSIAPIALAYFSFFTGVGVPKSTANYGEIINPALNIEALFADDNRGFYENLMLNKKWHLFIPVTESCDSLCEQNLYVTRQVHIRLGEKSTRVERILVNLSDIPIEVRMQALASEHPLLRGVSLDRDSWFNWLSASGDEVDPDIQSYYLLVDQEGFAMMRYTSNVDGGDLLKDLKRALKHSIDYQ